MLWYIADKQQFLLFSFNIQHQSQCIKSAALMLRTFQTQHERDKTPNVDLQLHVRGLRMTLRERTETKFLFLFAASASTAGLVMSED